MKTELQNKLFDKYPKIFVQKDLEIDTGDGWYNILDTLCGQIQNLNLLERFNVEATQVKEKFGGLRFYYNGGDEFIEGLTWQRQSLTELAKSAAHREHKITQVGLGPDARVIGATWHYKTKLIRIV